jgi:3-oxoadipate enol-lactonase
MQTLTTNGLVLHICDEGPRGGRPVLFANSLGTDLRVWDALLPHLRPGLRLIRFDKPGHGLSDLASATIADMADTVALLAGTLELRGRLTVVGLSIGGMIGQSLAARHPNLMQALVLMDTAARIGTPQAWQDRIDAIRANGIDSIADAVMERWFTPNFRATRSAELKLWRNMLTRTSEDGYIACCRAIAETDLTDSTSRLTLPTLALVGAQDGSTPPDLVRATAQLAKAEFHSIEGAGHIPCVEQPEQTAALLNAFLSRTDDV